MTSPHSDREIRRWARRHKIWVAERGYVSDALRQAYAAWRRLEDVKITKRRRSE